MIDRNIHNKKVATSKRRLWHVSHPYVNSCIAERAIVRARTERDAIAMFLKECADEQCHAEDCTCIKVLQDGADCVLVAHYAGG